MTYTNSSEDLYNSKQSMCMNRKEKKHPIDRQIHRGPSDDKFKKVGTVTGAVFGLFRYVCFPLESLWLVAVSSTQQLLKPMMYDCL